MTSDRYTVTITPTTSDRYPGEWYVVRVLDNGEVYRRSNLLTKQQADREYDECVQLYMYGRLPI